MENATRTEEAGKPGEEPEDPLKTPANPGNTVERADGPREAVLERRRLGETAEARRIEVENLAEKAQERADENRLSILVGDAPNFDAQRGAEREKNRQAELLDKVYREYRASGRDYYFKDRGGRLAFRDGGKKLYAHTNDERVAFALAVVADARGWKTIRVSGAPEFRRCVWMEARLRGIEVQGHTPDARDEKELEERRAAGRKPPPRGKTERQICAEAVAEKIVREKLKDAQAPIQGLVLQGIRDGLAKRAGTRRIPPIRIYDHKAPPARETARVRAPVERRPERTR
ncbi:MAG: hypothetical protein LBS70_05435 [Candidatus Accumulibacter sp.]|jgi:hypothetical protein|nr:hypothetical protein [Accumulibacter sp.]